MGLPKSSENFAIFLSSLSFLGPSLCSTASDPSLRPDLPPAERRAQKAVQDAALAAPATPARSVLDSFEHGASLAAGRDGIACHMRSGGLARSERQRDSMQTIPRGDPRVARATTLYSVDQDSDHDAVMRIDSEVLGGGPILSLGIESYGYKRVTAASDCLALHHIEVINAELCVYPPVVFTPELLAKRLIVRGAERPPA